MKAEESSWKRRWTGGITAESISRGALLDDVLRRLPWPVAAISAEQVHGSSIAVVGANGADMTVPGCDALITDRPQRALVIRTADCLPIMFVEPRRRVIGIAHAGWRGLAAALPARMVELLTRVSHSAAASLQVAIGPAICGQCYQVGAEFRERFGRFVTRRGRRWFCDLRAIAAAQLRQAGVAARHILISRHCTVEEPQRWYSVRRDGQATGRIASFIVLKP